jgi:hypothetical protein
MLRSTKQGPIDAAQNAFRVFSEAIGEAPLTVPQEKDDAAVARGKARSEKMDAEQRSAIGKLAAQKRWAKH